MTIAVSGQSEVVVLGRSELKDLVTEAVAAGIRKEGGLPSKDKEARALLTKKELAAAFGVSERTVDRWRERGLPCIKPGRSHPRYLLEEAMAWRAGNGTSIINER